MEKMVIVGAGGHGRVVLDIIRAEKKYMPVGFIDADASLHGRRIDGLAILGDISLLPTLKLQDITGAVVAIGDNGIRRQYAEKIDELGLDLINAIHPSANIAATATIGKNVVIASGATVCSHCQIGNSVILNTGSIVDHESVIATAAHICPGAKLAGRVLVESGAYVGIGATVIQNIRIGLDSIVGAGAVVIRDVPPAATVVGVPAHVLKLNRTAKNFVMNNLEDYLQEVTI
jgi:sugar O-acyltransferase (sialic acid O-acetyltransferase NeuD family)